MRAIDRLKRDHQILRSKLDVLEAALRMGQEAWFVLREVCFTLSRQLRDHIQREEALVDLCREVLSAKEVKRLAVEHQDEPQHLRTINELFIKEQGHTLQEIRPALTKVIKGLRRHMEDEEATLFPVLARVVGEREIARVDELAPLARLDESMTVNRVIQEYPSTRAVLESLFINLPLEGCKGLDEVAWCHGMASSELLARLEAVIPPGEKRQQGLLQQTECCGAEGTPLA